ncbi:MAG: M48 family metallopeptidase [Burkholderiales bacterium]|nr:M48 family metallopeptidase [Burkholderiales bacterium]
MRSFLQLALDLFDAAPVQASPTLTPTPQPTPPALHGPHQPAQAIDSVMAPAQFSHPRANRQTRLCDAHVAYEFKRGKRRTIGMQVGPDGLVVSAPRWVPLYEVEAALQEKADWIVRKLGEMRERKQRLDSTHIEWRDGSSFPFLGETVIVVLDPTHAYSTVGGSLKADDVEVVLHTDAQAPNLTLDGVPRLTLHIGLPQHASTQQIRDTVQAWLMRQAHRVFTERLHHYAPQLGVQWRKLSLSSAGTRWGSASSDGAIRLNWRLIHFRQNVIDYVVAHELSHLRVMDHSPRFWDTVRSVVPDYQSLRGELRDEALPRWH